MSEQEEGFVTLTFPPPGAEVVQFKGGREECWADPEWGRMKIHESMPWCDQPVTTDIGLCDEHYYQIFGR
jgi:hypothetical protein